MISERNKDMIHGTLFTCMNSTACEQPGFLIFIVKRNVINFIKNGQNIKQ